ncbi:2-succinyl-5-enolpyruvyl-6-hydroxy-3-cyclohexene-1-carboxylic-acid synthase [Planococcus sp. CP5-4]|uniref:2-succinyl-5-enolpyruvyl-6-hydroxy-3- cyclohexene-1-carboxylic-acid synthase n=1 Tax=unclassified Planococcus (in: firmicutes) TaxID=2662419 RepID=UPI001C23477D|nr:MULTISPECIES: 2-succinyl-5-enolpyruvyl-6-hydroxy-3-cyclohexene-1-carboxylic-acid synthase [unclassified Planococcus (in: firmicutes)]MBU9673069.1 2-succinyl-5-enolpyruvyl-6-hydroxy-3-cyclohexene-1-carboxylic-acid synthase [Planococcus sp. CP5-4_YE]MBV0908841.1 2-succinyl-5-enolpyruvyl-6-hydroxy-3-cyclohexene-1-carboxylic-acid synthase [Planococcus sp. CP5-4_UN]MBW6063610.1 2-succinyl-5-enolpyruvyl-6-hydroxy-3-cyclohexene-1-carboxylic-acid synthase [Planococcus sp. CP5-4]
MTNREYLTEYVSAFTHSLKQAGVKKAVISPGSRSTPLAYALMKQEGIETYRQIDERSAGFYALGLAKASNSPVILICTSGTAAANYFPAIVEAYYARVPLLIVTADRPHELREVGAPQAINQINLFGSHVKWSADLPLPEQGNRLDFLKRHLGRAAAMAETVPKGPVHLNVPFREPLGIDFDQPYLSEGELYRFESGQQLTDEATVFLQEVFSQSRGLLIAGENTAQISLEQWEFIRRLGWPVLADPLSNLRSHVPDDFMDVIVDSYDALLKNEEFAEGVVPDVVVRIGPQPVSKPLSQFLSKTKPARYVVIDESPLFRDPQSVVTHHIQQHFSALWELNLEANSPSPYLEHWKKAGKLLREAMSIHCQQELDEGVLAKAFFDELDGCDLTVSSSMPIRDADTYFQVTQRDVRIYANRGANGIDGVVSTAFGIQAANKRPGYLLIGDLALLHDMNGLLASKLQATDMTIVVMNNDGGGIFSYLPQSKEERYYEELFGTPTGIQFKAAAEMYDAEYYSAKTVEELQSALRTPKDKPVRIIEVATNRANNVTVHRKLWSRLDEGLNKWN